MIKGQGSQSCHEIYTIIATLLLPEARGRPQFYSSPFVCLFVTSISTHLEATALRLQPSHNNILLLLIYKWVLILAN